MYYGLIVFKNLDPTGLEIHCISCHGQLKNGSGKLVSLLCLGDRWCFLMGQLGNQHQMSDLQTINDLWMNCKTWISIYQAKLQFFLFSLDFCQLAQYKNINDSQFDTKKMLQAWLHSTVHYHVQKSSLVYINGVCLKKY